MIAQEAWARRTLELTAAAGKRIGIYLLMLAGVGVAVGSVSLIANAFGFHGSTAKLLRMLMLGFYAIAAGTFALRKKR